MFFEKSQFRKKVKSQHMKNYPVCKANGSFMKVESIAEYSLWSILQYFCPALIRLENHFLVFLRVAVLHRFYCKECQKGFGFRSGPTFCLSLFGSKPMAKVISRVTNQQGKSKIFAYQCRLLITFANSLDPDQV